MMKQKKKLMMKKLMKKILKKNNMNNRGMGMMMIFFLAIVALLIALISALTYALVNKMDINPLFASATMFWNTIKWWLLGIAIFIFLLVTGILKLIRTKIFHV